MAENYFLDLGGTHAASLRIEALREIATEFVEQPRLLSRYARHYKRCDLSLFRHRQVLV